MNYCKVFYRKIEDGNIEKVFPIERQLEIESTLNQKVKLQKYCVWELLNFALYSVLGFGVEKANITKNENGKWVSKNCFFSLSHNDVYCAVALSNCAVGVDVEKIVNENRCEKMFDKILTKSENKIEKNTLNFTKLWVKKESIFKALNQNVFTPSKIDTTNFFTKLFEIDSENILSVCCNNLDEIELINK